MRHLKIIPSKTHNVKSALECPGMLNVKLQLYKAGSKPNFNFHGDQINISIGKPLKQQHKILIANLPYILWGRYLRITPLNKS